MTDYLSLWNRMLALSVLPDEDRKALVGNLHPETRAGIEMLGSVAAAQMREILKDGAFDKKDDYLKAAGPVLIWSALNGYCLYLMTQNVNPLTTDLKGREDTKNLGNRWIGQFQRDQNRSYIEKIDPIVSMLLGKISELRVNQLLALVPQVIDLPYKTTERLNQHIGWAVYQGFVLGVMESEEKNHG